MHAEAWSWVAQCVNTLTFIPGTVVELGSRNVNGGVRDLFPLAAYTGVDAMEGPGVDVVANAADYVHQMPADVVVTTEMLEHTPHGAEIIRRCAENLRPGGVLILTAAGPGRAPHSAIDENPIRPEEHYGNVGPDELSEWLAAAGFTSWDIDIRQNPADIRAIAVR